MPAVEEPAPRLTLADFDAPGAPPDDYVQPPSKGGESSPTQEKPDKPSKPATEEPPIGRVADEELETPEPDPDKPKQDDEPKRSLEDEMTDPAETAKKERVAAREADKKAKDEAGAAASAKPEEKIEPPVDRDADLKKEIGAHVHPKTRKIISDFQAKTKAARDALDAEKVRAAELEKRVQEIEERSKTAPVPKEFEERLTATEKRAIAAEERARELDVSKDPEIVNAFDAPIAENNTRITGVLKDNGLPDGHIASLNATGLNRRTLLPYVSRLREGAAKLEKEAAESAEPQVAAAKRLEAEKASLAAEEISDFVRDNEKLARDRQKKIDTWKGDFSKRQQERESATKQQQEARSQGFRQKTDVILKSDLEALAKEFPYINQPPAPLATDTPATRQAKEKAIAEWTAASKAIEEDVKGFSTDGLSPEKLTETVGRLNAAAIQAIVMKKHILPRVTRELQALTARNKELESEMKKITDAGKLSRQHTSASNGPDYTGNPEPKSLEEAFSDPTA